MDGFQIADEPRFDFEPINGYRFPKKTGFEDLTDGRPAKQKLFDWLMGD